jgi:voltage-gated potassium channel
MRFFRPGSSGRPLGLLVALLTLLVCFGTFGYMLLEGFSFLDGLYMTIITLTTVGFGEVRPLGPGGRVFTIFLIFSGAGFVAYNLAFFTRLLLDGNLLERYRRRQVNKLIEQLTDHFIICGYGEMGQIIVRMLLEQQIPVVVLEIADDVTARLSERDILHIRADATEEESLLAAGIQRARGLVTVINKDTDNVFIVLTARDLNRDLFICSRASTSGTEKKLIKAGADRVVSPYASGAVRIAHNILRPTVTDFLELALSGEGMELSMEEFAVPEGAAIVGKMLIDSGIRYEFNLIVVAIKRLDGRMIYNPSPQETFEAGDILIIIGPRDNLERFANWLFQGRCRAIAHCALGASKPTQ